MTSKIYGEVIQATLSEHLSAIFFAKASRHTNSPCAHTGTNPDYTGYTQRFANKPVVSEAVERVNKRKGRKNK